MTFEKFKTQFVNTFTDIVKQQRENSEVQTSKVNKVNQILEGISIIDSTKNQEMKPVYYLEHIYEDYLETPISFMDYVNKFYIEYTECEKRFNVEPLPKLNEDFILSRVFPTAINRELNGKLLKNIPHYDILDVAIIFRVFMSDDKRSGCIRSFTLTNEILKEHKLTLKKIGSKSKENMTEIFGYKFNSTLDYNLADIPFLEITTKLDTFGSGYLFTTSIFEDITEQINSDLYVLPISDDKLWVLPTNLGIPPEFINQFFKTLTAAYKIADKSKSLGEFLSDQVYVYSKSKQELNFLEGGKK